MTIGDKIRKLETLRDNIEDIALDYLVSNGNKAVQHNVQNLINGLDADNIQISSYKPYAASTIKRKKQTKVDLKEKGDFHRAMKYRQVQFNGHKAIELYSDDYKMGLLVWKYGENIIGVTDEFINILKEGLRKLIQNEINNI